MQIKGVEYDKLFMLSAAATGEKMVSYWDLVKKWDGHIESLSIW